MEYGTYKRSGFTFEKSFLSEGESIYLEDRKLSKSISYIQRNNIRGVILNSAWGFNSKDLSFLNDIPFIEELSIHNEANIEPVNNLCSLKYLLIQAQCKQKLFLDNFKALKRCNVIYNKNILGLEDCISMESLALQRYPKNDLKEISKLEKLQSLDLYDSKIETLEGIEKCNMLGLMSLVRSRKLKSISGIDSISLSINELAIRNCRSIENYEPIGNCTNLETLYITDSAPAQSVSFFRNLNNLKYSYINIDILDGNVGLLLEKPVMFKNYKHFSHKNNLKIEITDNGNVLLRNGDSIDSHGNI